MVLVITTFALFFAILLPNELVNLLILGYDGVCQFFPGIVCGLFWKRVTKTGVFTGLVVGITLVAFLILTGRDPFLGMNAGFVGLLVNGFLTVAVSLRTRPKRMDTP